MRRFILPFLLVVLLASSVFAQTVHITRTGHKYHSAGCSYLKSDIPIDLKDAVSRGYTPCSRCNPPVLNSKIKQNTNTTQKIIKKTASQNSGERIGCICRDGTSSNATGRGACSHHGGVDHWIYKK
jgi:hypothetical protein